MRLRIEDDLIAPGERGLYRRAWVLATLLVPSIRWFGLMACYRFLNAWVGCFHRRKPPHDPLSKAQQIARLVQVAVWRNPFQAECLETSLAIWFLLKRHRIESDLRIGTRIIEQKLQAHAWVEYQGLVLSERTDPRLRYVSFDRSISPR